MIESVKPTLTELLDHAIAQNERTAIRIHWRWFHAPYWIDVRNRVNHLDKVEADRMRRIASAVARTDGDIDRG